MRPSIWRWHRPPVTWGRAQVAGLAVVALLLPACGLFSDRDRMPYPPPPPEESPSPAAPSPVPSPMTEPPSPAPVKPAAEEIRVRAWSEPRLLPPAGGQAQILVLARNRKGEPAPGIEVRFSTNEGTLFSGGKVLVTDASGRTRDRLTARRTAVVTVNVGGSMRSVLVPVGNPPPSPPPPSR